MPSRLMTVLRIGLLGGIAIALFAAALPLAQTLAAQPAPPLQAAALIREQYPAAESVVVALGSLRAMQIALPQYRMLYLGQFDQGWGEEIAARGTRWLILLDRDEIWDEAYDALTQAGHYVPIADQVFARDPRAFPQHSLVRLQILTPLRLLTPQQLALPDDGDIEVGSVSSGKYFGAGWYRAESVAGSQARWTAQVATLRVGLPRRDQGWRLIFEATPYADGQSVAIVVNGQSLGTVDLAGVWNAYSVTIPREVIATEPITTITLQHSHAETPIGSTRSLAAVYRRFVLSPTP